MWIVIQELIPVILVILFLTQIVLPLLFNKQVFWLFRPEKKVINPSSSSTLKDELSNTKEVVNKAKTQSDLIKEKLQENLKIAEDLKKDGDNNLI